MRSGHASVLFWILDLSISTTNQKRCSVMKPESGDRKAQNRFWLSSFRLPKQSRSSLSALWASNTTSSGDFAVRSCSLSILNCLVSTDSMRRKLIKLTLCPV